MNTQILKTSQVNSLESIKSLCTLHIQLYHGRQQFSLISLYNTSIFLLGGYENCYLEFIFLSQKQKNIVVKSYLYLGNLDVV